MKPSDPVRDGYPQAGESPSRHGELWPLAGELRDAVARLHESRARREGHSGASHGAFAAPCCASGSRPNFSVCLSAFRKTRERLEMKHARGLKTPSENVHYATEGECGPHRRVCVCVCVSLGRQFS